MSRFVMCINQSSCPRASVRQSQERFIFCCSQIFFLIPRKNYFIASMHLQKIEEFKAAFPPNQWNLQHHIHEISGVQSLSIKYVEFRALCPLNQWNSKHSTATCRRVQNQKERNIRTTLKATFFYEVRKSRAFLRYYLTRKKRAQFSNSENKPVAFRVVIISLSL